VIVEPARQRNIGEPMHSLSGSAHSGNIWLLALGTARGDRSARLPPISYAPWLLPRLSNVTISQGRIVRAAESLNGEVKLKLDDGTDRRVDHVLLGTGYRVDVSGYRFLDRSIVSAVRQVDGNPWLSKGFRSSVPGLHFIGATAAKAFGPLLYFVAGTEFASKHLSAHMHCSVETLGEQEDVAA